MSLLTLRIAFRYLFSKKSTNAINIINLVTFAGIFVMTAALIIVLSAFNGFEGLVISLYNTFNPELKVSLNEGKVFSLTEQQLDELKGLEGVEKLSLTLEENAALRYKDYDYIGVMKGVDDRYVQVTGVDQAIYRGVFALKDEKAEYAVLGAGVSGALRVVMEDDFSPITIYMPSRKKNASPFNSNNSSFKKAVVYPAGVFSIQQEFDMKYVFVSLNFLRKMLDYKDGEVSAVEIKVAEGADIELLREAIQNQLGEEYKVADRFQQNEFLYRVMQTEKWAVYAILSFIMIIASFNIIGSLSMVVLEKKKDISILKTMGATNHTIRSIFLSVGMLTAFLGCVSGALVALIICLVQIHYEIVPLPGSGTFVIDAFPIVLKFWDFVLVIVTVMVISAIAAWLPARRAAKQTLVIEQE